MPSHFSVAVKTNPGAVFKEAIQIFFSVPVELHLVSHNHFTYEKHVAEADKNTNDH